MRIVEGDEESNDGNSKITWRVRARQILDTFKKWFMPLVTLFICNQSIGFTVDTGAEVNFMDESTFRKLRYNPKLYKCDTKLYGYGKDARIETFGKIKTRVLNRNR